VPAQQRCWADDPACPQRPEARSEPLPVTAIAQFPGVLQVHGLIERADASQILFMVDQRNL
jgi:hypothetical protein